MRKNPSTRWFFKDWEDDKALKACSLAAQGLWMRMLCQCAENHGFLRIAGKKPSLKVLARRLGIASQTVRKLLAELHEHEVFSVDENGVIYNRRMARAHEVMDDLAPNAHARAPVPQHSAIPFLPKAIENPSSSSSFETPKNARAANGTTNLQPVPVRCASPGDPEGRSAPLTPSELSSRHWRFLQQTGHLKEAEEYVAAINLDTGLPPKKMLDLVDNAIKATGWLDNQRGSV